MTARAYCLGAQVSALNSNFRVYVEFCILGNVKFIKSKLTGKKIELTCGVIIHWEEKEFDDYSRFKKTGKRKHRIDIPI